jgi:GNAT superfamily N-acetyltransferase
MARQEDAMSANGLTVRRVDGKRDFEAFLGLPWEIYRDDPFWVPPMRSSARGELRPRTNPFLRHCDHAFFLLERAGKVAGRVAALVDAVAVEAWGQKIGLFGYFECATDDEAGGLALLGAARDWLREKGMTAMRGPWTFQPQEWGLVVEGFEPEPVVMAPFNPPEYALILESFGLRKEKDLLCWELSMPDGYRIPDRILTLTDTVAQRFGLSVRMADFSRFDEEVALLGRISMDTLKDNWGITPMTDAEVEAMARDLKALVRKECVLFARNAEGRDIGFALTIPDINVILKETRGRMLPLGWARLIWGIPRIRRYRMFALGVTKDYQGKGVDALLYRAMWERMAEPAVTMEINYVLEDNLPMVNAITKLGAKPSRRYRVYQMPI